MSSPLSPDADTVGQSASPRVPGAESPATPGFTPPAASPVQPSAVRSPLDSANFEDGSRQEDGLRQLPQYSRSLLKVRVPVKVTLASAKQSVQQILSLGPGSIIQFSKSSEDTLQLEIGDQTIAAGEAVQEGDKFGLWITSMTMPEERFWVVHGRRHGQRVK